MPRPTGRVGYDRGAQAGGGASRLPVVRAAALQSFNTSTLKPAHDIAKELQQLTRQNRQRLPGTGVIPSTQTIQQMDVALAVKAVAEEQAKKGAYGKAEVGCGEGRGPRPEASPSHSRRLPRG
jgi:hypothetical protein